MWQTLINWIMQNYTILCIILLVDSTVHTYFHHISGAMSNKLSLLSPAMAVIPAFGAFMDPEKQQIYVICTAAILMGCALRFGMLHQKNELSWKIVSSQFIITIPLCVTGYWIWDFYKSELPIHILLFFVSLFSIFIAGLIDSMGRIGIKAAFSRLLKYLAAKVDEK